MGNGEHVFENNATLTAGDLVVSAKAEYSVAKTALSKTYVYEKGNLVEYTIDVNSAGRDLLKNATTITLVDEMGSGMRLATEAEKENRLTVTANGKDITAQCVLHDNTNVGDDSQAESGDGTAENPKPHTFTLTIPDNVHATIKYYVVVDGLVGDDVELKNSVYYYGFSEDEGSSKDEIVTLASWGSSSASPSFNVYKEDESGNPLEGVTFTLYQVELDADGAPVTDSATGLPKLNEVTSKPTDATGIVRFEDLDDDLLYCYMETGSLAGYMENNQRYYLQFTHHTAAEAVISDIKGAMHDATLVVKNYKGTSYQIPVAKTINYSSTSDCTLPFSFTLKKKTGDSYTDEAYTNAFSEETVSIKGTGNTTFSTLYFNAAGTYEYTIRENDTDATQIYTKDTDTCEVTIVVGTDNSGALCVESATFKKGEKTYDLTKRTPTFNNSYNATGSVILAATKKLEGGRTKAIADGEFTFLVVDTEYDEVVATGKTLAGSSTSADIVFTPVSGAWDDGATITYNQDDIGKTHVYEISEVVPEDTQGIDYTTDKITVTVEVTDNKDGSLHTEVTYKDASGTETKDPTFTNTYSASGSITLKGTKKLTGNRSTAIQAGEFNFVVKEETLNGGSKEVAKGSTDAGTITSGTSTAAIRFEPITYDETDIGKTYTYTVSEVIPEEGDDGYDASITYAPETWTVIVTVEDGGSGKLRITPVYELVDTVNLGVRINKLTWNIVNQNVTLMQTSTSTASSVTALAAASEDGGEDDGTEGDSNVNSNGDSKGDSASASGMTFVNEYRMPVPTGIRVDRLPYLMMIAIATCASMLLTIYKRRKRSVRRG
jgi:pilin isopeptide linkage protein